MRLYSCDDESEVFATKDGQKWLIQYDQDDTDPMSLFKLIDWYTIASDYETEEETVYIVEDNPTWHWSWLIRDYKETEIINED